MNKTLLPLSICLVASVSAFATTHEISSADELRNLNACAAADTIKLTESINMEGPNFAPLCPEGFYGVFDGGDKTISKMNIVASMKTHPNMAFIAILGDGGKLKNVTFQEANIVAYPEGADGVQGATVAVAVGKLEGGSVENVHVIGGKVAISLNDQSSGDAGGLAGSAETGSISESGGDISVGGSNGASVGGICGSVMGDVTLTSVSYIGDAPIAGSVAEDVTLKTNYGAVTISQTGSEKTAVINGNYGDKDGEDDAVNITGDISVNSVVWERDFGGAASTIPLPFEIDVDNVEGAKIYNFGGMATKEDGKKAVQMNRVKEGKLAANKPYGVRPTESTITFKGPVTFKKTEEASVTVGEWKFVGLFAKYIVQPSDEGRLYGFAGESKDGIPQGKFVRFYSGAPFNALRAYMFNIDDAAPTNMAHAPGLFKSASINSSIETSSDLDVDWNDDEEGTAALRRSLNAPMIFKSNKKFDLKGRPVGEKTKVNGAYYGKGGNK